MIAMAIMVKAPQPGEVKTRLCPPLTDTEAADLYHCFLLDTIAKARALTGISPVLAYTPADSKAFFAALAPDFTLLLQQGDDLGAKMNLCFTQLFELGFQRVLLTGSDLPTLPRSYLQQAVTLLTAPQTDVVLGASEDGGYYLIGLCQPQPALFANMRWSTPTVFAQTTQRAVAQGLNVAYLPPWHDIDTPADLERLRASVTGQENGTCRHTQQYFQQLIDNDPPIS
jgi:rSAM/selenodomain-associated transferase 1